MALTIIHPVTVQLTKELIDRISAKSAMPAVEGLHGILTRLLDEHDTAYKDQPKHLIVSLPPKQEPTHFRTQRGFDLPIGLELFANYRGHKLKANVTAAGIEYKGKTYEVSPSAFAAKKDCGATNTSASTNGWKFWQYKNEKSQVFFIDSFRPPVGGQP